MDLEGTMLSENKPDRERQILYDITYYVETKKAKLIKTESRVVVTRGQGRGGKVEMLVKG